MDWRKATSFFKKFFPGCKGEASARIPKYEIVTPCLSEWIIIHLSSIKMSQTQTASQHSISICCVAMTDQSQSQKLYTKFTDISLPFWEQFYHNHITSHQIYTHLSLKFLKYLLYVWKHCEAINWVDLRRSTYVYLRLFLVTIVTSWCKMAPSKEVATMQLSFWDYEYATVIIYL